MADANITEIVKKYIDILLTEKYKIINAYLFGSYAKGNFNEDSDIDVALVFDKLKDRFDTRVELMKLGRRIDLRIEPHPFSKKDLKDSDPFLSEVLRTGIKI
ncbi:MAG: nucleotidyltransferase domain-containing protein [Candidatus Delongbacteria bacterium]|nr:nucleotidyltransferase domain-containing protein [Candidatus Delongbacteria bacterium]MCG2760845.1 nucleotidyltransferase domain-containing protein [Candidatus Delongbacteria bacterium]